MNKLVEEQSIAIDWLRFVSECNEPWPIDRRYALEILAHIERLEANQIPEGYVAVPMEPTEAMMTAGQEAVLQAPDDLEGAAHYIYTHMVAAARKK